MKDIRELYNDYIRNKSVYQHSKRRINDNVQLLKDVKAQYLKGVINQACYQSYKAQTSKQRNAMNIVIGSNKRRLKASKKAYHDAKNKYDKEQHLNNVKAFEQLIHSMSIEQVRLLQEYKHLLNGY